VDLQNVLVQITSLGEACWAVLASVGSLACVDPHVVFHVQSFVERPLAKSARKDHVQSVGRSHHLLQVEQFVILRAAGLLV